MKLLVSSGDIVVPDTVKIEVTGRKVRVKGSRGTLVRDFKHLAVDMYLVEEEGVKKLKVDCHFGKRKRLAAIRTVCSHVQVSTLAQEAAMGRGYTAQLPSLAALTAALSASPHPAPAQRTRLAPPSHIPWANLPLDFDNPSRDC